MASCNLKINIVGYVGLSIDFLLHLIIKSKKLWRIQKLMQILRYIYIVFRSFPLKRNVTSICCCRSWIWFCCLLLVCFVALLFAMLDCWDESCFLGWYLHPSVHPLFIAQIWSFAEIPLVLNHCRFFMSMNIVSFLPCCISESQTSHPAIDGRGRANAGKSMCD